MTIKLDSLFVIAVAVTAVACGARTGLDALTVGNLGNGTGEAGGMGAQPDSASGTDRGLSAESGSSWPGLEAAAGGVARCRQAGQTTTTSEPSGATREFSGYHYGGSLTLGPDCNIWILEGGRIGRVSPDLVFENFSASVDLSENIVVGPDNAFWFPFTRLNKIARLQLDGMLSTFDVLPSGDLNGPSWITPGPDNDLWFTYSTGRIGRITTDGGVTTFNVSNDAANAWDEELGSIVTGHDRNLWFTLSRLNTPPPDAIGRITISGQVDLFPLPTDQSQPLGIAAGPDGNVWFVERIGRRVGRITPEGTITEFVVPDLLADLEWAGLGPDGNVWFTERAHGALGRITPDGMITEHRVSSDDPQVMSLAAGADGRLWFYDAQRVGYFVP